MTAPQRAATWPQAVSIGAGSAQHASDALRVALGYLGIFPPVGATYHRQACPRCSPWRAPRTSRDGHACTNGNAEKPLKVRITSETTAEVICYHCSPEWERIEA